MDVLRILSELLDVDLSRLLVALLGLLHLLRALADIACVGEGGRGSERVVILSSERERESEWVADSKG